MYDKLYEFITQTETVIVGIDPDTGTPIYGSADGPKPGVDYNVWMWVSGARFVNSGEGFFADLIRDYTAIQYRLRTGLELSEDEINGASNRIAKNFYEDAVDLAGASIGIPDIVDTGKIDAGLGAAPVFGGNYSPWAGTVFFANLGEDSFFRDWVLNMETTDRKFESGTYDLISVAASFQIFSTAGAVFNNIWEFLDTLGTQLDLEVRYGDIVEALQAETNQFFKTQYALGDGDPDYLIGDDIFGLQALAFPASRTSAHSVGIRSRTKGNSRRSLGCLRSTRAFTTRFCNRGLGRWSVRSWHTRCGRCTLSG